ncbi:SLATT domain-containing protein [Paenibacillus sp. JJ1722]|uniref:SLATT domain-containing protein n=1 Tax=Paenibacillus sp. JJ1722 TaxID=3398770 RepID=UPI003AAEEB91
MEEREHERAKAKIDKLIELIKENTDASTNAGIKHKENAKRFKKISITVSALITVILGWSFLGEWGKNAAIALSALLTALNTWDAFSDYLQRSIQERVHVNKLLKLENDMTLYLVENCDCQLSDYKTFKDTYDQIYEEYSEARNKKVKGKEGEDETEKK